MACREEEIPEVGDHIVYDIGRYSVIVVRTADGIRAHHNVCRHRGRRLCDRAGHAPSFICPFHGFSWNLDGTLRSVTSDWDFPHIDGESFTLTPVRCDTWGGWVFVNMDVDAEPLADFLGDLPEHFAVWRPEDRYIQAHVAKVMRCNWKVCQEAFMEAFHVIRTHPQILTGIGDENSQYDAWGNFSRAITANGTPSPHLPGEPSEQEMFESVTMRDLDDPPAPAVPPGTTARAMMAAHARAGLQPVVGEDTVITDACVSDSIYYTLFPNFHPWGGYSRIVYRFRPHENRCDRSLMECYYLSPFAGERRTRRRCTCSTPTSPGPTRPSSGCWRGSSPRTRSTSPRYRRASKPRGTTKWSSQTTRRPRSGTFTHCSASGAGVKGREVA